MNENESISIVQVERSQHDRSAEERDDVALSNDTRS
jgi:hypothetical protein